MVEESQPSPPIPEAVSVQSPTWTAPQTNREIEYLLKDSDIWEYSMKERKRIVEYWSAEVLMTEAPRLERLRTQLLRVVKCIDDIHLQTKHDVLKRAQIIGVTTNG